MTTPPPRPTPDPGRAAEDTSRVEQITVDTTPGARPSRLPQQGQVIGRGTPLLYLLLDDNHLITLQPHHVRVLTTPAGNTPPPEEGPDLPWRD